MAETNGQDEKVPAGHNRDDKATKRLEKQLAKERAAELTAGSAAQAGQWWYPAGDGNGRPTKRQRTRKPEAAKI